MMKALIFLVLTTLFCYKNTQVNAENKQVTLTRTSEAITVTDVLPGDTYGITCEYDATGGNVHTFPLTCFDVSAAAGTAQGFFSNNPDSFTTTQEYYGTTNALYAGAFFTAQSGSATGSAYASDTSGANSDVKTDVLTLPADNAFTSYVGCACKFASVTEHKMVWFKLHPSCPSDIGSTCGTSTQQCFDVGCNEHMCDSTDDTASDSTTTDDTAST